MFWKKKLKKKLLSMKICRAVLIFSIVIIFFNGCKTKTIVSDVFSVLPMEEEELVNRLNDSQRDIDNISFKRSNVTIKTEKQNQSFKSNLYIERDSFVRISVLAPLGIEVARISFEPDSVTIIDRLNREVVFTGYDEVKNRFGIDVDFYLLQNILLNKAFSYFENKGFHLNNYHGEVDDKLYLLQSMKNRRYDRLVNKNQGNNLIFHKLWIHPENFYLTRTSFIMKSSGLNVDIQYNNFTKEDVGFFFPGGLFVEGNRLGRSFYLEIVYGAINVNDNNSISFSIPGKYEKIYR